MDILNGAIESLIGSSNKEDWTPVALNVADATVTISKDKVRHTDVWFYKYLIGIPNTLIGFLMFLSVA